MKKSIITLVLAFVVIIAQAQIKMTYKSHGLKVGDTHDFVFAENTNEGVAGKKVLWDYSSLKPSGTLLTSHMMSPESVDPSQQVQSSNTVIQEFGNNFFFNVSKDGIDQYGSVACNTVTKYDKPFVKMKYPFTYGTNVVGTYTGTQTAQGTVTKVGGSYELSGDAYGTLILPGNITYENVLRVKQTRVIQYENNTAITKEVTYRWYAASVRYPILVVIQYENNGQKNTVETAYYAKASTQKSSELVVDAVPFVTNNVEVSPNPYETEFTVSYNVEKAGKVNIELYDNMGRFVETVLNEKQDEGVQSVTVSPASYGARQGIYFLKVSINGKSVTKQIVQM